MAKRANKWLCAQIMTTSVCPASCFYCAYPDGWHKQHPGHMTEETFELLLERLRQVGDFSRGKICMYLMNEPLADPDICHRIERVQQSFPGTLIEINTNALLLNEERGKQLAKVIEKQRHQIHIHLSGYDEETSQRAMGLPFQVRYDNVDRFLGLTADHNIHVEIEGFYRAEPNNGPILFSYHPWHAKMKELSSGRAKSCDLYRFHDRAGTIKRHGDVNFGVRRDCDCDKPGEPCRRVHEWIHVDWQGRLRICCNDYHREIVLKTIHEIPNLKEFLEGPEWEFVQRLSQGIEESLDTFICKRCRGNR